MRDSQQDRNARYVYVNICAFVTAIPAHHLLGQAEILLEGQAIPQEEVRCHIALN